MAARRTPPPLRTAGSAWGPERVRLGISIRRLEELSGIGRSVLSQVEAGRVIPTGAEYQAVMAALREVERQQEGATA